MSDCKVPTVSTNPKDGFTKVELVVVIAIIAVLALVMGTTLFSQSNKALAQGVYDRVAQQQLVYEQSQHYSVAATKVAVSSSRISPIKTAVKLADDKTQAELTFPSHTDVKVVLQAGAVKSCEAQSKKVCERLNREFPKPSSGS